VLNNFEISPINKIFQGVDWLNKNVPVLIGIFIFFNPFPHTTAIKEICFYLSAFIVIILFLFKKNDMSFETPFMVPFGLFVFWSFLGLFFALDPKNSTHDFYSHLLKYVALYFILINLFRSKKNLIVLSWIIIISSSIFSIGGMLYYYCIQGHSILTRFGSGERGAEGFIQMPVSVIGVITVFAIVLSMNNFLNETNRYRKIIISICFFSLLFSLVLSQTRSVFIPFCLAVFLIFITNKKAAVAIIGMILIIAYFSPFKNRIDINVLTTFRIGINYHTFQVIKDYPIMGIGFGMETFKNALDLKTYHKRVPKKYRENSIYDDPHNMFFDITVRLGIVGFALFFYIIFVFFKMCWDIIKYGKDDFAKNWGRCLAAALFSFLFIGYFHPVFSHMPETILCAMFSMLTIVWRFNNERISNDVV
jgi:O-antigen ligase